MFRYAQTNLQLYRQLAAEGYGDAETAAVVRAYEVGLRLFPGTFRGSGKPFLAHLVGTASVLASLRARAPLLAAGLLHAAYSHGEFGNGWRGMSEPKRRVIREAVGDEVEDLIARYTRLPWRRATIPDILARVDALTLIERDVLILRLANELEDHLDLGILYLEDAPRRRDFLQRDLPAAVEMAERLGVPALATALAEAFDETAGGRIAAGLQRAHPESYRIPFASHRLRLRVALSHLLARHPWR
ncbi:MAG TPA: HD domain-containing protein [Methylomirabilota bacterium]|nr:HD domain-containing protein [Methylomirabilota bacterium]